MGILSTLTGQRDWQPHTFDMPMVTNPKDLRLLGTDRVGRRWWATKYGEVLELTTVDATRQPLPNNIIVEVEKDQFRTFGSPVRPGTYEKLMSTALRAPRPPKPHRPIPATAGLFLAEARPERIYASSVAVSGVDAEPAARGGAEYVARIERTGAKVHGSANPEQFRVDAPGGVLNAGVRELVQAEHRTIAAYVNKVAIYCEIGKHPKPVAAVITVLGGSVACAGCGGAS